jgi:hypothetical protein
MRATASADAFGAGTTPDGWIRLAVDLNMGAGGKYIYFEILPPPPASIFHLLSAHVATIAAQSGPGNIKQPLPQVHSPLPQILQHWRPSAVPPNCICALAVQDGKTPNLPAPGGHTQIPVDLNMGAGGDYIYASYKVGAPPLTGIAVIAAALNSCPLQPGLRSSM